ncbi:MAG: cytochrome [Gemmatimonadaceae bacterium]
MGAADATPACVADADRLGELLAEQGWIVLTGGRPFGVMEAASRGAKRVSGSLTIGILPTADEVPSAFVDVAIRTDLGHGRNNVNVLTSDVVFACGVGGPGTASEVALAVKNGRPVVLVAPTDAAERFFTELGAGRVRVVRSAEEAAAIAQAFLTSR